MRVWSDGGWRTFAKRGCLGAVLGMLAAPVVSYVLVYVLPPPPATRCGQDYILTWCLAAPVLGVLGLAVATLAPRRRN